MGYHLNSIYSISPDDTHTYFVFMLGGYYGLMNSTQEWLDKNFTAIAKVIGPKAAIVRGLSSNFEKEVISTYQNQIKTKVIDFNVDEHKIEDLVYKLSEQYNTYVTTPILLVTNNNPRQINEKNNIFYLIPIGGLTEIEIQKVIEIILFCINKSEFNSLDVWLQKKFGNLLLNGLEKPSLHSGLQHEISAISINLSTVINKFQITEMRNISNSTVVTGSVSGNISNNI